MDEGVSGGGEGCAGCETERRVVGWGNAAHGQLGVVREEDGGRDVVTRPRELEGFGAARPAAVAAGAFCTAVLTEGGDVLVSQPRECPRRTRAPGDAQLLTAVACGSDFVLALTDAGAVLSWGSNAFGQLGCGATPAALPARDAPGLVRGELENVRVVQLAAGAHHWLAVSDLGELYACGRNHCGQLGATVAKNGEHSAQPVRVRALWGQPVAAAACGDAHSVVLTALGAVLSFGSNEYGQLGLGSKVPLHATRNPTPRRVVLPRPALQIACGAEHTLVVVEPAADDARCNDGCGVAHAFGRGSSGQLGCGSTGLADVPLPVRAPVDYAGALPCFVSQVAAGRNHSAAITADGMLLGWGGGSEGQLGDGDAMDKLVPIVLHSSGFGAVGLDAVEKPRPQVTSVACGAFHTVALFELNAHSSMLAQRAGSALTPAQCCICADSLPELHDLGWLFGSAAVLLRSFGTRGSPATAIDARAVDAAYRAVVAQGNAEVLVRAATRLAREADEATATADPTESAPRRLPETMLILLIALLNPVLSEEMHFDKLSLLVRSLVRLPAGVGERFVAAAGAVPSELLIARLVKPLLALVDRELTLRKRVSEVAMDATKALVLLYATSIAHSDTEHPLGLVPPKQFYCSAVTTALDLRTDFERWQRSRMVVSGPQAAINGVFKNGCIARRNAFSANLSLAASAQDALAVLHERRPDKFSFCAYAPFMLGELAKSRLLRMEAISTQQDEQFRSLFRGFLGMPRGISMRSGMLPQGLTECMFRVRRAHVIEDSMNTVAHMSKSDLRKPLRVHFEGEPGVDEGGLTKEFFQLLVERLFSPDYGMFTYDPETRLLWFNRNALDSDDFRLVGLLVALAVYNSVILDLHFPRIVYTRLLRTARVAAADAATRAASDEVGGYSNEWNWRGDSEVDDNVISAANGQSSRIVPPFGANKDIEMLDSAAIDVGASSKDQPAAAAATVTRLVPRMDSLQESAELAYALFALDEVFPDQARSLRALLTHEPAAEIEDTFCLTFSVDYDFYGEHKSDELVAGGAEVAVTAANRALFALLYARYLLHGSVRQQMSAFEEGFAFLMSGGAMELLTPEELEGLVCGEATLDFEALRRGARYEGGYEQSTPIVEWFWELVMGEDLSLDQRRKLLAFVTGSDRAPVGGLGRLKLVIQRAGPDDAKLPTAHTCFNVLLLPEYASRDKLRDRLLIAIENAQGFGLQ